MNWSTSLLLPQPARRRPCPGTAPPAQGLQHSDFLDGRGGFAETAAAPGCLHAKLLNFKVNLNDEQPAGNKEIGQFTFSAIGCRYRQVCNR